MYKKKNLILFYPSFEKGGVTNILQNLIKSKNSEQFIIHIVALSRATLDLTQKIKQRDSSASRFTKQVVVLDEHRKAVIDDETGAKITTDFIPRSVRDKNPVRCSDDVKEDTRIVAVMQRTVACHELYKKEQVANVHVITDLEIAIMKENLNFHSYL